MHKLQAHVAVGLQVHEQLAVFGEAPQAIHYELVDRGILGGHLHRRGDALEEFVAAAVPFEELQKLLTILKV